MPGSDYIKGLSDGFALALAVIKGSRDVEDAENLEDAMTRVKLLLSLALEHKMTELKRRLGYVAIKRS